MKQGSTFLRSRAARIGVIAAAVLIALYAIGSRFFFSETLVGAGSRILGCVKSGDAGCLYSYTMGKERDYQNVSKESIQRLLDEYIRPSINQVELVGKPQMEAYVDRAALLVWQDARRSDGEPVGYAVYVVQTDDGVRAPMLLSQLLLNCARIRYGRPMLHESRGLAMFRAWEEMAEKDGPALAKLGFRGVYLNSPEGFYEWPTFAKTMAERREKLAAAQDSESNHSGQPSPVKATAK